MKKTQKESYDEIPLLGGGTILDAANLRRDPSDAAVWRRAGKPKKVFPVGALPFLRFSPYGDGRMVELWADGENILYGRVCSGGEGAMVSEGEGEMFSGGEGAPAPSQTSGPSLAKLAQLAGEPILAVTGAEGIVRLMLRHAKDCFLTYDANLQLTYAGEMPELPEITLEARDSTVYYATTGTIPLTGGSDGRAGSQLAEADAAKVKAAMLAAYKSVREQARKNGAWVQPVTARYRLTDAAGNTVALGEKTALGCSGTVPTGKVLLTSSDGMQTLASGSLSARSYNPAVKVPERLPYPWNRIIAKMTVEVTQEMEPVDASATLPHGIQRNAASGVTTVTAQLPGLEIEDQFTRERYARLAAMQLKAAMYRPFGFDLPFGGGMTLDGEALPPGATVPLEGLDPAAFEVAPEGAEDGGRRRCTYSAALDAGEFTVLCNPKDEEGNYRPGVAEVVRSEDLGAVLSRRRITEGEITAVASLPRSGSGWDFSRLKLLMFGGEGTRMATLNGKGEFHSVTTIDRRGVASHRCVCEATGENGATLLAVAGGDVVEISGQKVATLWSRRELPQGRVGAESLPGLQAVGWNEAEKEIWLADTERLWRLCDGGAGSGASSPGRGRGGTQKRRELIRGALPGIEGVGYQPPFRFGRYGRELLLATSREVRNLSCEEADGLMDIRLRIRGENRTGRTDPRLAPRALDLPWLRLRIFGTGLLGNYRLRGDRGTEVAEELLRVVFTGDVNSPVPLRVLLPGRDWLEEEYTFAANADLAIHNSQFIIHNS